jgi:hypothetical protein
MGSIYGGVNQRSQPDYDHKSEQMILRLANVLSSDSVRRSRGTQQFSVAVDQGPGDMCDDIIRVLSS